MGPRPHIKTTMATVRSSPLQFAHGNWTLTGYFAVEGAVGVWMGQIAYSLIPVPLEMAAS